MIYDEIIRELEANRNPDNLAGMARFGITPEHTYGWRMPDLRQLAKRVRPRDKQARHELAAQLWANDNRETRILASLIDEPKLVTPAQMDVWTAEFDYWEICDQCCANLFQKTPYAYDKAYEWSALEPEYVKRAGFVMMARIAVKDKKAPDENVEPFLAVIEREADDPRDMVKKGSNWALRQIGKRNVYLNARAIETANRILVRDSKAAGWVARDALKELQSTAVQNRLNK